MPRIEPLGRIQRVLTQSLRKSTVRANVQNSDPVRMTAATESNAQSQTVVSAAMLRDAVRSYHGAGQRMPPEVCHAMEKLDRALASIQQLGASLVDGKDLIR